MFVAVHYLSVNGTILWLTTHQNKNIATGLKSWHTIAFSREVGGRFFDCRITPWVLSTRCDRRNLITLIAGTCLQHLTRWRTTDRRTDVDVNECRVSSEHALIWPQTAWQSSGSGSRSAPESNWSYVISSPTPSKMDKNSFIFFEHFCRQPNKPANKQTTVQQSHHGGG